MLSSIYDAIGKTQFAVNFGEYVIDMAYGVDGKNQVALIDDEGNDIISTSSVIKVTGSLTAEYPSHNMEDGTSISDHSYFNPFQGSVAVLCDSESFGIIENAWSNRTKLTIQSKTGSRDNIYITQVPSDEDLSQPDKIRVIINLKEQRFDSVEIKKLPARAVKNPSNQTTSKRGKINKNTANESTSKTQKTKQSVALQAFESIFG
jgi:hypothetical protein